MEFNKRIGDILDSEDKTKKAKQTQNAFLIFDIPENKSVEELKAICENKCFIPTSKGNHLKMMYYFFNSDDSEVFTKLQALISDCILEFNARQTRSIDIAILEIQSIINGLRPLVDQKLNSRSNRLPPGERVSDINPNQRLDNSIKTLLDTTKQRCLAILIQYHEEIIAAFRCLEKGIAPGESRDISINDCNWLALFCIIWLFAFKISTDNIIIYRRLFIIFGQQRFLSFFENFQVCDKILMHLIVDLFWQLTIFENQFIEEEEVISFLPYLVLDTSLLLQGYSPEIYEILPKLFQSALVKAKIENVIINEQIIEEFISKIYLVPFPASLQGLTLFNSYIAIKRKADAEKLKNEPIYQGFTLMTILHEFGHFMQRIHLNTNMQWLNNESPEYMIDPLTQIGVREAGSEFITKLFGHDVAGINIPASEYIMEINNWNNLEKFNTEFDELNTNIGEDMRTRGVLYTARLSQKRRTYLSLIGCCKGNR